MHGRHKRHLMGKHSGASHVPPHVSKHGKGGKGPVEHDTDGDSQNVAKHAGKSGDGKTKPALVSGNPTVVAAAHETKSLGKVPGIAAPKRLDRKQRPGGVQGSG